MSLALLSQLRPFAVDISSGVERSKGMKDEEKVRALIEQVRIADQTATA
jgi:phosphoribosylanthranilate isomerase